MSNESVEPTPEPEPPQSLDAAVAAVVSRRNADIFLINSGMDSRLDERVIALVKSRPGRYGAVVLILVTYGGSPEVAYRIARCFQRSYEHVFVLVPGPCKSAGTLLAIGAHTLIISDNGQLGPLDIQVAEKDELFGSSSGLLTTIALTELGRESTQLFEDTVHRISTMGQGRISFRTATDTASHLVVGLFSKIYEHIQPMQVGANGRANSITTEYAYRLDRVSDNLLSEEALATLVSGFPSHEFVIDREEAVDYFRRVLEPTPEEEELLRHLGSLGRRAAFNRATGGEPFCGYISQPPDALLTISDGDDDDAGDSEGAVGEAGRNEGALAVDRGRASGSDIPSAKKMARPSSSSVDNGESATHA